MPSIISNTRSAACSRACALARDPAACRWSAVLFNLDQALDETAVLHGLACASPGVPRAFENFELFVNAVQVDGGLRLECQYNSDLFDAATIAQWLAAYRRCYALRSTTCRSLPVHFRWYHLIRWRRCERCSPCRSRSQACA